MKITKTGVIAISVGFVVLLAMTIGLTVYSGSKASRVSLLTGYFRALATGDKIGLDELTAPGFFSDLQLKDLERGSYELFDFGETAGPDSMVQRFLLIVDAGQDGKIAHLADMEYRRKALGMSILSIRRIGRGLPVKP